MRSEHGRLRFAIGPFNPNLETGIASVRKRAKLEVELGVSGGLIVAIGITLVILRPYLRSVSAANEL